MCTHQLNKTAYRGQSFYANWCKSF